MAPYTKTHMPQAFTSSYAPRLRTFANALLTPVAPQSSQVPAGRTTKRGTTAINYAEDGYDDDDLEDSEGPRRPTGLRSLRRDDAGPDKAAQHAQLGKELFEPVEMQGIWRDWMGRSRKQSAEKDGMLQAKLPYVPIPIRIDVNLQPFKPAAALPVPGDARAWGIDDSLAPYKSPDITVGYRLKDNFLWNLFEALNTPDQFARALVDDLDLPVERRVVLIMEITTQIRQQLEEYAGVALHPLFETESSTEPGTVPEEDLPSPPDDFRCIINLNITLRNQSLTDKFEWNLLHPPGVSETFAQNLSADMGLNGEWTAAITHGLYEAVLRLKKEAIEKGGLRVAGIGDLDNNETEPGKAVGWRYDPETLCALWGPHIETLSKEDMERREYDRERQIRRVRRETARFSSTANIAPQTDYFAMPDADTPMGRGERNKRKRRFRSISPNGRGTPDGAAGGGYGGQGGGLQEWERQTWRCLHCRVLGYAVWGVRDGPNGHRTLCHNCGYLYERFKRLPAWAEDIHAYAMPLSGR